jgi:hypothetical protein
VFKAKEAESNLFYDAMVKAFSFYEINLKDKGYVFY